MAPPAANGEVVFEAPWQGRVFAMARLLAEGFRTGDHSGWIERLLSWYYDPMYDYQLEKKAERVIFRGDADAVRSFLADYQPDRR